VHISLADGGTIAFIIATLVALAVIAGAIAFAFWYDGDQDLV